MIHMWQRVDAWAARDCGVIYSIFCWLIPFMKWTGHDYTVVGDQAMSQIEKGCEDEYLDTAPLKRHECLLGIYRLLLSSHDS